ncbi:MAG: class I SAM-dependent methyltransferase [Planctomycetaceae bacterium]|nr:MAG: class I SAM-dependent methyltransferase [Planctomycetaceae bacterium]
MPAIAAPPGFRYRWARPGDVNAFFGLMFDNLANLMLLVMLLSLTFGFPGDFIIRTMVPGTALGVVVGDLAFVALAFRLARRTGRDDVTAMPLGIDTPSLFGMVFFVLGPSFVAGRDLLGLDEQAAAIRTWHIGIWCLVLSGLLKLACAPVCGWVRAVIPRAGLLGSLAAIALVLISFMPMLEILAHPLPGLLALVVVLTTLVGRIPLPGNLPGTFGALVIAGGVYYLMILLGFDGYELREAPAITWLPTDWLGAWTFAWVGSFADALPYLPIAFPFALMTVVGGIDCTESAAAAGDDYDTRGVVAIEGVATLVAGLSGGVIQTTPYIGHPAYKAMGGRAAYALATAALVGTAGIVGYFEWFNHYLPIPVVLPILVFIGLEITSQSFSATPRRHYPAVALGCVPALAFLSLSLPNQLFGDPSAIAADFNSGDLADERLRDKLATLTMLSNSFILTSLMWAWVLASIIDRKLRVASIVLCVAAGMTLFGVIHSPLTENRLFLPLGPEAWGDLVLAAAHRNAVWEYAAAYLASAGLLSLWGLVVAVDRLPPVDRYDDEPAGLGWDEPHGTVLKAGGPDEPLSARVLEPEVMETFEEAFAYDQMDHAEVNRRFVDDLLAGGPVTGTVVDLGTGTALIPIELCRRLPEVRVLAIDASAAMLDLANRHLEIEQLKDRVLLRQADCKSLSDYEADSADVVISNSLIHHLPEPAEAVAAALRVLRPGGRLFIRDLVRPATRGEWERLVEMHAGTETAESRAMFRDSLAAALSLAEARDLFGSFGLFPADVRLTSDRHWTFDGCRVS